MMLEIPATEFIRKFRQYNLEAQREPVAVTNHGKVDGYYVSAIEFDELQKEKAAMRRSYTLQTLPDPLYTAIANAKVDPKYDYLNELLNDENSPVAAG
jgi:prevent-host-death family protein